MACPSWGKVVLETKDPFKYPFKDPVAQNEASFSQRVSCGNPQHPWQKPSEESLKPHSSYCRQSRGCKTTFYKSV